MTVTANKGTPLSMPEVQAEPEINVVTYDEEEPSALPPIEAVPVTTSEDMIMTTQQLQQISPLVPPNNAQSNNINNSNSVPVTFQQQQQQRHDDYNDNGFECVLCGDTRMRRISPGFNIFISLCGDTHIDIRDSIFPIGSNKLTLLNIRLCGNTNLCVPPGTRVVVRRLL